MPWSDLERWSPSPTAFSLHPETYPYDVKLSHSSSPTTPRLSKPLKSFPTSNVPPLMFNREYELIVRQEPKQARMCGIGGKADRRPIDPPPIVQLRVNNVSSPPHPKKGKDPQRYPDNSAEHDDGLQQQDRRKFQYDSEGRRVEVIDPESAPGSSSDPYSNFFPGGSDDGETDSYTQSFLQNPYFFMFASLAKPDDDTEMHWLKDGRTRCTTGSVVSSLYHLKDTENNNEDAGFFVFPDLSVRTEGSYRLKLSLFEVVGNNVRHCKSVYSSSFYVYTAKKFPGMEESTALSCSLADQGIKIRIRKDIRVRKKTVPGGGEDKDASQAVGSSARQEESRDDDDRPKKKRARMDGDAGSSSIAMGRVHASSRVDSPMPPPSGPPGVPLPMPPGGTLPPVGARNPLGAAGAWPTSINANLRSPTITPPAPRDGFTITPEVGPIVLPPPTQTRPIAPAPAPTQREDRHIPEYEPPRAPYDRHLPPPPPSAYSQPPYAYGQGLPPPPHAPHGYPHYPPPASSYPASSYPAWGTPGAAYDPYAGGYDHAARYYGHAPPPPPDPYGAAAYHDHRPAYGDYPPYRPRPPYGYGAPAGHYPPSHAGHPHPMLPPGHQLPVPGGHAPPMGHHHAAPPSNHPPPAYSTYGASYPPPAPPPTSALHPPTWGTPVGGWSEEQPAYRPQTSEPGSRIQLAPLNLRNETRTPESHDRVQLASGRREGEDKGRERLSIGSMVAH